MPDRAPGDDDSRLILYDDGWEAGRYPHEMTDAGRREVRRRKYLSLGVGELAAAAVFAAVLPRLVGPEDRWAVWFALIPLLVVLLQAGGYWLLARAWVARRPMPASLATVYRAFRWADAMLLTGGLVGVLLWLPRMDDRWSSSARSGCSASSSTSTTSSYGSRTPSADGYAVCASGVLPSWSRTCGPRGTATRVPVPRHPTPSGSGPGQTERSGRRRRSAERGEGPALVELGPGDARQVQDVGGQVGEVTVANRLPAAVAGALGAWAAVAGAEGVQVAAGGDRRDPTP